MSENKKVKVADVKCVVYPNGTYVKIEDINAENWCDIVKTQPEFVEFVDFSMFNPEHWINLLTAQPQFKDKIDLSEFDEEDWVALIVILPEFREKYFEWKNMQIDVKITELERLRARFKQDWQVTPEDVCKAMEMHGESLTDLNADYCVEFMQWFSEKEPEIYKEWFENDCVDEGETRIAEALLFDFSNNTLNGRIFEKHDQLLAEFANVCDKAKKHIRELLANED